MSDFSGMEDLLQDFLQEASDLLSDVDNKLVDLEKMPDDRGLLNDIFRGFHTVKGGAGFLNATELVTLCHLTENLFDKLRNGELAITPDVMDVILSSTGAVRDMFGYLEQGVQPAAADPQLIDSLRLAIALREKESDLALRLFLMSDAVTAGLKGQKPAEGYNIQQMLEILTAQNVPVKLCKTCTDGRGITGLPLIDGVEIGTLVELAEWTLSADKVLTF